MNLQGNGNNHNHRPKLDDEGDSFISFRQSADYERITGLKVQDASAEFISEEERASKLKEAIDKENSSAFEDLDDFIYTQNKRRRKSSSSHGHRSASSESRRRRSSSSSQHEHTHRYGKRRSHRKKMKKWKKAVITIISIVLVLIIGSIAAVFILINAGRGALLDNGELNIEAPVGATSAENGMYITYKGVKYKYNENVTSILCMGIDEEAFSDIDGEIGTGGDADTLFVLALDLETGETNIINISRDTMAEIGIYSDTGAYVGTREAQICLAYAYGDGKETSCDNEVTAVRNLLYNVPINSYLAMDIQGIGAVNDAIGGVTVTSPETIDSFKEGETYTLRGSQAQSFVRSRSHATVEGNSLRMQRQKIYLESFAGLLIDQTKSNITTPVNLFNQASPYLCTNIDVSKVAYFSVNALRGTFRGFDIKTVEGETKKGEVYAEFYPNEDKLFELFLDIYYTPVGNE